VKVALHRVPLGGDVTVVAVSTVVENAKSVSSSS
jgi:hypothetical protein